jgi:LacI family transcriptional regulator
MNRPVTMKDLARSLNLAVSTVARALADSPQISHETKALVRTAADEAGYVADSAARAMRRGTSSLVGLIVPDVQNEFYSTVAKAISDCCHDHGLQLVLSITDDDPDLELHHVRNLCSARAVGIVMVASANPARETVRLLRVTPHVQLVRKCPKVESDWFGVDDVAALQQATRHLIELGHTRIAYVGGSTDFSTGADRLDGFRRAHEEAGIDFGQAVVETGGCDAEFAYAAMARILSRGGERPTATVTAGARIAVGAFDCLRARGVEIPGDMSFVGFSDSPAFRWWGSGLTTIGLPVREIALACSAFLLRRAGLQQPANALPYQPCTRRR